MPGIRRKIVVSPGGPEQDAELVEVQQSAEQWNQYLLADGAVIRFKAVVIEVWRILGQCDQDKRRERQEIEDFEREHAAFRMLLPNLGANYNGRFVAIHRGAVVDSDASREELVRRFFARFGDVPVYIGYVGQAAIAYQVTPFQI